MDATDRVLAHDAGAAKDTDRGLTGANGGFACHEFDLSRQIRRQRSLVDAPGAVVDQPSCRLDIGRHVGEAMGHRLVIADAPVGDYPIVGIRQRSFQRRSGQTQRVGRNADPVFT